jgi:hypothetical protein
MSKTSGTVTFIAVAVAVASACGARSELELEPHASDDAAGVDGPTLQDAVVFPDVEAVDAPEEHPIFDAAPDASSALGCPPADMRSYGCPDGVCIIGVTAGTTIFPDGGINGDILSYQCVPPGMLNTSCLAAPVYVYYDPNTGQPVWAVCVG